MSFYKMDPGAWDFGTANLTLEQEAAYLRIVNAIHHHCGPVPDNDRMLAGMFRCSTRKARALVIALVGAGKLTVRDGALVATLRVAPAERLTLPLALRQAVLQRDGKRCIYCGDTEGPHEIDHIHPVALGGSDDIDNLACACRACNRSKGARTPAQWREAAI